ncbi:MAG: MBL fold metallo-hydrolase [Proteobacteria bacterium]|jgi:cyclase|nr:MBL fold metallo-hydrolase [Pseudomonadota bacterium]MDA1351063.1 MBL fold metallo-hydrolase [Pseudomonadota bacterium]
MFLRKFKLTFLLAFLSVGASSAHAHDGALGLDEVLDAFGWDLSKVEIRTEKVTDNFYVLFGAGGNIGVSVGAQGVLIVDDQFPEMIPKVDDAIREIGGGSVDFAVNTHWHFDHAEGNLALGPGGTWLVSQANSREKMLSDNVVNLVSLKYLQKAYPKSALPVITFDDTMQFHFNGEQIDLMHFGPAHTTGDTAVILRGSNIVHLGDVFNRSGYPFIDADNGGDLAGMIAFCQAVLDEIDETTIVVPGHGEISDYAGLENYIKVLSTLHGRFEKLIKKGKTLEEVIAAEPTKDFDAEWGANDNFVNRAYTSVKRELAR